MNSVNISIPSFCPAKLCALSESLTEISALKAGAQCSKLAGYHL